MRDYVQGFIDGKDGNIRVSQWTDVDIESIVLTVLKEDALERWWATPIPALGGNTPIQMSESDYDYRRLIAHVLNYVEPM